MTKLNIALDGPAGSGKSSVAREIARRLNILYLDTGAMYRAVGFEILKKGIDVNDRKKVESEMKGIHVTIRFLEGHQRVFVGEEDVTDSIRTPEISKAASDVSAHPAVRLAMVEIQRQTAEEYDMILDGRDIGTFVLPDCKNKFFLTASKEERAKRRFLELKERGIEKPFDEILGEIEKRDFNDSNRDLAPLKRAEDAMLIDSTSLNRDEVVEKILSHIKRGELS